MLNRLKKWLSGEADWKAEQELNRMGKKDSFLKDAMEGYQSMPEADHARAVGDLKGRLQKQYVTKAGKGFNWMGIAAGVALVGAVGLFFWTQRDLTGNGPLVQSNAPETQLEQTKVESTKENKARVLEDRPETAAMAPAAESSAEVEASVPIVLEEVSKNKPPVDPSNIEAGIIEEADLVFEPESEAKEAAPMSPEPVADDAIAMAENSSPVSETDIVATPPPPTEGAKAKTESGYSNEAYDVIAKDEGNTSEPVDNRAASTTSKMLDLPISNTLNGKVVDLSSEEALIGASIYIKETGEGTTTDLDGNFALQSNTALPWTVVSAYTGFGDEEHVVNNLEDSFYISMDNSGIELSEVTVTGLEAKKRQKSNDVTKTPEPKIGFKRMKRYIRKNMKYPEIAKQNKIQGGVTVRFYINEKGLPEELSVLNSLGSGCDKEAMRLIEDGPEWKPAKVWAIYTVVFNL